MSNSLEPLKKQVECKNCETITKIPRDMKLSRIHCCDNPELVLFSVELTDEEMRQDILSQKVQEFYDKGIKVDLYFLKGTDKRGYITSMGTDFFFFRDEENTLVFLAELLDIKEVIE